MVCRALQLYLTVTYHLYINNPINDTNMNLEPRQINIITHILQNPGSSSSSIHKALEETVSLITVKRDLKELTEQDFIKRSGRSKSILYTINPKKQVFIPLKNMANKEIDFIGVPTHWGVGVKELIKGPESFRAFGFIDKLRGSGLNIVDAGDIDCNSHKKVSIHNARLRFLEEVVDVSRRISKKVEETITGHKFPLVIGGDHSVEIGAISGANKAMNNKMGVIYIDEHGDLINHILTDSGNIHGMTLSAVMGMCGEQLSAVSGIPLKKENLLHVGAEKLDVQELEFCKAERIKMVKLADIIRNGIQPVFDAIDALSAHVDGVWVSLDIDVMDAQDAPGVTMPDRFGLTYREISAIARYVSANTNVVGLTIAEYNYARDEKNKTLELMTELTAAFLGGEYSWYSIWMGGQGDTLLSNDLFLEAGLLDQLVEKYTKEKGFKEDKQNWVQLVEEFLKCVVDRRTPKSPLSAQQFSEMVGFAKYGSSDVKQKRRDIFWRSAEDIKKDVSLGIFRIDVPRLSFEKQQKLFEYFVSIIYKPLYESENQLEITRFFIALYKEQFREQLDIRVGILHSLSGTMAISETSLVDGALMAIDEINERGGVLGKRLKPIIVDGASDPNRFALEAENLITKQGVRAVFGGWTSASRKTMAPIFEKYNNLLWYPVQHEGLEQSPNIIYTGAVPNQQILPAVDWTCAKFGKKVFLVGSDYVFPRTANAIITHRVEELGGKVVGEEYRTLGSKDFKAVIKEIREAKPDVIFNTINGGSNIEFFEMLRRAGIMSESVPTISFSISEEEIQDMKLENVVGDYSVWSYFQSIDSRANRLFVDHFKKKYGDDRVVNDPIAAAYTSVHLFAKAVEKAGADDSKSVREALGDVTFESPEGMVKFDKETQHLKRTIRIGRIEIDGQFEVVWESDEPINPCMFPTCRPDKEWNTFLNDLYIGWGKRWQK